VLQTVCIVIDSERKLKREKKETKEADNPGFDVHVGPDENETDSMRVLLTKYWALEAHKNSVHVKDLLPTDKCSNLDGLLANRKVELERSTFENSLKRMTPDNVSNVLNTHHGNGCAFVNAKGAPFADSMIVFKGKTADTCLLLLIQDKQSQRAKEQAAEERVIPTHNYDGVKTEHEKCCPDGDCSKLPPHIFLYVTDAQFSDYHKLKENEVVIAADTLRDWMGPLLSVLRLNRIMLKKDMTLLNAINK